MKREYRYLSAKKLRISNQNGKRTLTGYAAVFNSPSQDLGGFTETIRPGAFSRSLANGADVKLTHEHDPRQGLLGRTKSGTLDLKEDSVGLRFSAELPNTTLANDVAESVSRGDIDGCSFGFRCPSGGDDWAKDSNGNVMRTLKDVDLFDVCVTSDPAYTSTGVQLRSRLFPDGAPSFQTSARSEADRLLASICARRQRF